MVSTKPPPRAVGATAPKQKSPQPTSVVFAFGIAVIVVLLAGEIAPRLIALPEALQQVIYARDSANPGLYQL